MRYLKVAGFKLAKVVVYKKKGGGASGLSADNNHKMMTWITEPWMILSLNQCIDNFFYLVIMKVYGKNTVEYV